jgi:hypothetical protein
MGCPFAEGEASIRTMVLCWIVHAGAGIWPTGGANDTP